MSKEVVRGVDNNKENDIVPLPCGIKCNLSSIDENPLFNSFCLLDFSESCI